MPLHDQKKNKHTAAATSEGFVFQRKKKNNLLRNAWFPRFQNVWGVAYNQQNLRP